MKTKAYKLKSRKKNYLGNFWDMYIEKYLKFSEKTYDFFENSDLISPNSNKLFKIVFVLLIAVFVSLLVSCEVPPEQRMAKRNVSPELRELKQKSKENLYIKRDTLKLKDVEEGSHTGSIWADSKKPRELFAEERPRSTGEFVTMNIPEDLQFKWPQTSGAAGVASGAAGVASGAAGVASGAAGVASGSVGSASGESGAESGSLPGENLGKETLKNLRMQIVATDPTGDTFLRANRNFKGAGGEIFDQTIFVKIPTSKMKSYELNAKDVSEVTISNEGSLASRGAENQDYGSTGWDKTTSRILSGYQPDIDSGMAALDKLRDDANQAQKNLKDSKQAIQDERERILKDRQRLEQEYQTRLDRLAANRDNSQSNLETNSANNVANSAGGKSRDKNKNPDQNSVNKPTAQSTENKTSQQEQKPSGVAK